MTYPRRFILGLGTLLPVLLGASPSPGQDLRPARSGDTLVVSLADAETIALRRHPTVERARSDLAISEARRTQASHARFLPRLDLRNVWGPIPRARGEFTETGVLISPDTSTSLEDLRWFTQVELNLLQPIHTFGRLGGLVDAAESGAEASRLGVETAAEDVRLQVRQLYWGLVLGEEMVRVAEDVRDRFEEAGTTLEERDAEGTVTQAELFKFRIFSYEVEKRLREARDRLALAQAGLRAALGVGRGIVLRTEAEELRPLAARLESLETYLDLAMAHRPELGQLEAGVAARAAAVRAKRAEFMPQLFLGAEVVWNRAPSRFDPENPFVHNPTNFFRPGLVLGFNWNMNVVQTRDEVRLAEYEEEKLRAGLDPLRDKVWLDVREAYLDATRAAANLEDSEEALTVSESWLRTEAQTFDLGLGEIGDLIDAFQANSAMRVEHLRNIFEFNSGTAELSRAVGLDLYPGGDPVMGDTGERQR